MEEVQQSHFERIQKAFAILRERIDVYRPGLFIIVGGDQSEMFDPSNVPNLMLYLGDEAWADVPSDGEHGNSADRLRVRIDTATSKQLLDKLVREEDFDVAISTEQQHLGPRGRGLPSRWPTIYRSAPAIRLTALARVCKSSRSCTRRPGKGRRPTARGRRSFPLLALRQRRVAGVLRPIPALVPPPAASALLYISSRSGGSARSIHSAYRP